MENSNDTLKLFSEILTLTIAQLTIDQYNENNNGAYFWIAKSQDNDYKLFCHLNDTTTNVLITNDEKEIDMLEEMLKNCGYEITKTEKGNALITITKEKIMKLIEKLQNEGFRITKDENNRTLIPYKLKK